MRSTFNLSNCTGSGRLDGALPQVTFAVRPRPDRRAILNEADIVAAIR